MKTRTLILVALIMAVLIVAGSCATQKQTYIPKQNEALYGTWVNTDYGGRRPQKFIIYNWRSTEYFERVTYKYANHQCTFYIMDKWTDSEEIIWYNVTWQFKGAPNMRFYLVLINTEEGSWEQVWSYKDFLPESDLTPEHVLYGIWYRQ